MRRSATQLSRAVVALLAFALVGCGSLTTPATSPASGGADATSAGQAAQSSDPSSQGGGSDPNGFPMPDLPGPEQSTILGAAQAELDLRHRLREEVGAAELFGPAAPAALAAIDAAEQSFGEAALADFVAKSGLNPSAAAVDQRLAAVAPMPPRAPGIADTWSGSLFGATSFMVSTWLGFVPEALQQSAGNPKFEQGTQDRQETHDSDLGAQTEHLVLTEKITYGAGQGRVVFDVVITSASTISDKGTNAEAARRASTSTGHFEVDACPDAQGIGAGRYTLSSKEEISRPRGPSNGGTSSTEATFRLIDGDDAHLIRTEVEAALTAGAHGTHISGDGSVGDPFDWGVGATYPITIPAHGSATYGQVRNPTWHDATPENFKALSWLLVMADHYLAEAGKAAETFWRSGKCIELKTSEGSRAAQPNEQISLAVDANHAFDKQPVKAPVKATFNGQTSLSPTDTGQAPPASFTFIAGPKQGDKGTIDLTQTGVRGIGKKTVEFTVAGSLHFGGTIHYEEVQQFGDRTIRFSGTAEVVLLVDDISGKLTTEPDGGSTYSYDYDSTAGNSNAGSDCKVGSCISPACKSHLTGTLVDPAQFTQPPQGVLIAHGVLGDDILQLQIAFILSCGGKNVGPPPLACTGDTDGLKAKFDGVANYRIDCSSEYDRTSQGFRNTGHGHVSGMLSPLDGPFPTRGP